MRRPVLLAALTALAVRALIIAKLPAPSVWDGAIYARLAEQLHAGHGFVHWSSVAPPFRPTAFFPVGYPAALALLLAFGVAIPYAAYVVNLLASAVSAMCSAVLGYRVAGTRGGYLGGLAYALAPGPALFTAATMTETLTGALLALAVTVSVTPVSATRARISTSGLAGLFVGAAALVRPQMLLAAPFLGALPPATRIVRALATVAAIAGALAMVLPWTARNCATLHGCAMVSTNGGSNLLIGTFPDARGGFRDLVPSDGCTEARGEIARDRCMTRLALRNIAARPLAWLQLDALKIVKTVAFEWTPVSYLRSGIPGAFPGVSALRASIICTAWWWAIAIAAIVGGRRALRAGGRLGALATVVNLNVLLVIFTHAVFIADDRYHQPLVPLLAGLAAGVLLPSRPSREPDLVWAS